MACLACIKLPPPFRGFASAGTFRERSLAQLPENVLILCCFWIGCYIIIHRILYTSRGMAYLTFMDVWKLEASLSSYLLGMTTCYPLVRLRERNLEKGTLYPEGMENYLSFSPLHHSVRQREDCILSAGLIRPRFGWGSREKYWASEKKGTRHWEEKLGAEYREELNQARNRVQSLGFWGFVVRCVFFTVYEWKWADATSSCIVRPFD